MIELRHHPRAHPNARAVMHARACVARCQVDNLSIGGVLLSPSLDVSVAIEVGARVMVELYLAGTAAWIVQRGRVQRFEPGGPLAIAFDDVSPEFEDEVEDEV